MIPLNGSGEAHYSQKRRVPNQNKQRVDIEGRSRMQNETERLRKIIKMDGELNKIQDLDILLERILRESRLAVGADAGTIYVKAGTKLEFKYWGYALDSGARYIWCLGAGPRACLIIDLRGYRIHCHGLLDQAVGTACALGRELRRLSYVSKAGFESFGQRRETSSSKHALSEPNHCSNSSSVLK